jgi:putative ABC transport system ATP-binding protein
MFDFSQVKYKHILDIPSLSLGDANVTTIIGRSGSGKTTLLKLLNKLISPTEGEIYYEGKSLKEMSSIDIRKEVLMLPQMPVVFKGSIKDNLLIGLRYAKQPAVTDARLNAILESVYLYKQLNESADILSGGEKQRLALGRILLLEPKILLLDEPSSALDESTEESIIQTIINFAKDTNKKIILITHNKQLADMYGEDVIELEAGKVKRQVKGGVCLE